MIHNAKVDSLSDRNSVGLRIGETCFGPNSNPLSLSCIFWELPLSAKGCLGADLHH